MTDVGGGGGGGTPPFDGGTTDPYPHDMQAGGPGVADAMLAARERRQKMLVVGLASIGGVVLLIGLVAFLLTRDGGGSASPTLVPTSAPSTTATS